MAAEITSGVAMASEPKRLDFFERHLSLWVFACMVVGVALGKLLPELTHKLSVAHNVARRAPLAVLFVPAQARERRANE
jgi:ACR3 family arsenite efflux pump ArsB